MRTAGDVQLPTIPLVQRIHWLNIHSNTSEHLQKNQQCQYQQKVMETFTVSLEQIQLVFFITCLGATEV
jgi:hypothetical protein